MSQPAAPLPQRGTPKDELFQRMQQFRDADAPANRPVLFFCVDPPPGETLSSVQMPRD